MDRRVQTRARWRRNSAEAASSEPGLVSASAKLAASATWSGLAPERASSTAVALKGVEPMLVSPTRTVGSMRVYTSDELERLRLIKHLVDEAGVNLAGVQRLLSIAEAVQRLRPLVRGDASRPDARRRMAQEIERIGEMVGL